MNVVVKNDGFKTLPLDTLPSLLKDVEQKMGMTPRVRAVMLDVVFETKTGEIVDRLDPNGKPMIVEASVKATPKVAVIKDDKLLVCKMSISFGGDDAGYHYDAETMQARIKNDFSEIKGLRIANKVVINDVTNNTLESGRFYDVDIYFVMHEPISFEDFVKEGESIITKNSIYNKAVLVSVKECESPSDDKPLDKEPARA